MTTTEVENYPGFREGITGPELMDQMREQALRFGADLRMEDVEAVSLDGPVKSVTTADGETFQARAVILAMGAAARYLGVPGEQELLGRGVSTCATCDGFFFRDQDIAVIGGGDSAMEEATFLTKFARSVTLVHRREEFRASKIMLDRARANDKITFLTNSRGHRGRGRAHGDRPAAARHRHRRGVHAGGHRRVRRDRPRPPLGAGPRRRSTSTTDGYVLVARPHHRHLDRRRVRRRRPRRPHLPPGHHRGGHRLFGAPSTPSAGSPTADHDSDRTPIRTRPAQHPLIGARA